MNKKKIYEEIENIKKIFPFKDYKNSQKDYIDIKTNSHFNISSNVLQHLELGSKVLDIGCGPLDNLSIIKKLGYDCYGVDDHNDPWHNIDDNKSKIYNFAEKLEIPLFSSIDELQQKFPDLKFDMILLNDIIEHLHNSPRFLFENLNKVLKVNGLVLITTPNCINLKKRIKVAMGETNYGDYKNFFFHSGDNYRGHIREYSKKCLEQLCEFTNYEIVKLEGCHQMLNQIPDSMVFLWKIFTSVFPNLKDSFILIAKKTNI